MKSNKQASLFRSFLISLSALILALIVVGVIIAILGNNPFKAYTLLFSGAFGSLKEFSNTLANSVPLMFTGLAFVVASKANVFNLGGEGQLYIGGMCGTVVALFLHTENRLLLLICVFAASLLGGMVWGGITGALRARFGINEVIVAIMLNYIASFLTSFLVTGPLREPGTTVNQTTMIPDAARLIKLVPRTQLTTALLLALLTAIFVWFLLSRTMFGFKLRAVGDNREAAQACGIPCARYIIFAMLLSGAIASLAGITEIVGKYFRFREGFSNGFGFTGVAVAVLANNNPFGVLLAAILFGGLDTGSLSMSRKLGLSGNMTVVIQSVIILIVATPRIIEYIKKLGKKGR